MNILDKIKNNWNHKESVEQNVICFSNEREQRQRRIKKWYPLFIVLFVIACLVFPINPLVGVCLMMGSISFGSEYIFKDADTMPESIIKIDSTHFLIAYADYVNSKRGTIIIGTVSGSTISFGSEYVFNARTTQFIDATIIDSTHFIVLYRDYSSRNVFCKVGTIAGDYSITFGRSYTVCDWNNSYAEQIKIIDSTHFMCCFVDVDQYSYLKIGTIAGDYSITFGSEYAIHSNRADSPHFEVLDSTHIYACYVDVYDSYKRYGIIGVISNDDEITFQTRHETKIGVLQKIDSTHLLTIERDKVYVTTIDYNDYSITYGSAYDYSVHGVYENNMSVSMLDSSRFIIVYYNNSSPYYSYAVIGTIAGDYSITFGSEYVVNSGITYFILCSALSSSSVAIAYKDASNSNKGTSILATITSAPTITTQSATNISTTSCTGNGNITATGGANCTRRGFCYKAGTSGDPTTSDSVAYDNGSFGTGAYTKSITGLTPGTSYRVRAYAVNSAGTGYGSTVTVTTLSAFIPRTMWF